MNEDMETLRIIAEHLNKYPKMKPQDITKLLYQKNYGPEHMVTDPEGSLEMLKKELSSLTADPEADLYEEIGNHFARLNLAKAITIYTPEEINDMFVRSAGVIHGSMAQFLHDLKTVQKNMDSLKCDFSLDEYNEFLSMYRGKAYPSVHHTPLYRDLYDPHYRVVFMNIWNTVKDIESDE